MTPLQKKASRFDEMQTMILQLGLEKVERALVQLSYDGVAKYNVSLNRMTKKEADHVIEKTTTGIYDTSKFRCQVIGGKTSASLWIWRHLGDGTKEGNRRCELEESKVKIEIEGWLEQNKDYCERNNDE